MANNGPSESYRAVVVIVVVVAMAVPQLIVAWSDVMC